MQSLYIKIQVPWKFHIKVAMAGAGSSSPTLVLNHANPWHFYLGAQFSWLNPPSTSIIYSYNKHPPFSHHLPSNQQE